MIGLKYQLKYIGRDKMCILTFLLPIVAGMVINLLSGVSFQTMNETSFGILAGSFSTETAGWLRANGTVTQYETLNELQNAVNDPSTQMIGVLETDNSILTLLSGDELEVNRIIADTLPKLFNDRSTEISCEKTIIPVSNDHDGLKSLLIVITLVTAMFMGCTFNAMNMISEKEDGVAFINMVLPMTTRSYIIQKILLGFIGSVISTVLTVFICVRTGLAQIPPFLLIIVLSAYIAALAGLFIGHFADGLMSGIVYIKVIMILFLAPPIFFYLTVPTGSALFCFSYILPSSATFYGLINLLNGQSDQLEVSLMVLCLHAVLWTVVYKLIRGKRN